MQNLSIGINVAYGGAFSDAEGSSDFLGNDDSAGGIDTADYASRFPIFSLLVGVEITVPLFVMEGGLYWRFCF